MKICLIRHGETDWNRARMLQGREDIPLNANGYAQAEETADALADTHWDCIISSPLSRAVQTADVIARKLGIQQRGENGNFIERDYGKASGLSPQERKQRFPDNQYEGMEDWEQLRSRVYGGLLQTVEKYRGKNIIIISHGAAINSVLSTVSGGEIGTGKTRLATACLNMLVYTNEHFVIESYNQTTAKLTLKKA